MRRHLTAGALASILAVALPASALAAKSTLGQDRAAINRYGANRAKVYKARWGEPLEWKIEHCLPQGPNGKRVDHLLCAIEIREAHFFVVAMSRRNRRPHGYSLAAKYGPIDVYTSPIKARSPSSG